MTPNEAAARAVQWLEEQVAELTNIRNATSRDPSFKNWRQNTLTIMQRIWPGDQVRSERFRRIPFSPADPRADARLLREWYSRGCQEAARLLNSFVQDIRREGVPETSAEATTEAPPENAPTAEFEDDFPTVDLPTGDLGIPYQEEFADEETLEDVPPQGADPDFTAPPGLQLHVPTSPPAPASHPAAPADPRPARKGLGVAAKLRDLLGLGGAAAKPQPPASPPPPSLDILPVGSEVETEPPARPAPPSGVWQRPRGTAPATPPAPSKGPEAAPPANMSVIMSKPTTLRTSIEKVSIESLISPKFREGQNPEPANPSAAAPPAATPAPATPATPTPPPASPFARMPSGPKRGPRPGITPAAAPPPAAPSPPAAAPPPAMPPLAGDPEFEMGSSMPRSQSMPNPVAPPASRESTSKVVPLPKPSAGTRPGAREPEPPPAEGDGDTGTGNVDAEEFARATEDFMRSSPVLGATGRKVQRPAPEGGESDFHDPDAIAILSVLDELTVMGVPATRQSETRARLVDLARRIERADLEWNSLRKAVWFAMEYPELARRVVPVLLPWIDRAA